MRLPLKTFFFGSLTLFAMVMSGCPASQTPATASFTASASTGSVPFSVQFKDTSSPGTASITTWAWDFGDGGKSDRQNPLYVYEQPGVYTVSLAVTTALGVQSTVSQDFITAYQGIPVIVEDGVLLSDGNAAFSVTDVQENGLTGTFPAGTALPVQVGQVLVSGQGNGFARRVANVSQNGNGFTASTEPASLTEIFQQVDVTVSGKFSKKDFEDAGVVSDKALDENIQIPNVRVLNQDGLIADFTGDVIFAPSVEVDLRIQNNQVTHFEYRAAGRLNLDLDVAFQAITAGMANAEVSLFDLLDRERPVTLASSKAGAVPVVVLFELDLLLAAEVAASGPGNFSAGFDSERDITLGARYNGSSWTSLSEVSLNPDVHTPTRSVVDEFDGRFQVEPVLTARLFALDGPELSVLPYGIFGVQPLPEPLRASWTAGVDDAARFDAENLALIGDGFDADFVRVSAGPEYSLWTYTTPQPILTVTPPQRDVSAVAGTTTFTITNTGTGNMPWTASIATGGAWIDIALGAGSTLDVTYYDNPDPAPRSGSIIISAEGAARSPVAVTVNQAGASKGG